jgi:pimeloyl-ACP methyl ester carboxylesterase
LTALKSNPAPVFPATSQGVGSDGARELRWPIPGSEGLEAKVFDSGRVGGVPFVFLHGLVGLNEHWEDVASRVRSRVRCIMFELPLLKLRGDHCSIHGATDLTARFLREYGMKLGGKGSAEPVVLVGNSFGGHVAARLAIEQPSLVRGLVLAGASGIVEKSTVSEVQLRPSREWLVRKIGELFHDTSHMRETDVDRAFAELSDRDGARAMVRLSRSARKDHLGERMREIRVPTLLVWGRQDVVTPPEAAEGFRRSIPGSQLVWFENCGHAPMIEKPEEFAAAILEFAGRLESSARSAP